MRKQIILIIAAGFFIVSCNKDPDPVSTVVTVSYPAINLHGEGFMHIPVNGTYTEQGATLIDDITGASSEIQPLSTDLDPTTPGVYKVTYVAANTNGFKTTVVRNVLVLDFTPPVGLDPNFDLSGDYLREATGVITHVTKLDNGLYGTDHVGGSTAVAAYFVTPDVTSFDVPLQMASGGLELEGTTEVLDLTDPAFPIMSYKLIADGFGTGNRIFVRQ